SQILAPYQLSRPSNLEEPYHRPPRAILGPKQSEAILIDPFHRLQINPRFEYKNARLLSSFVSEIGRIKGRAETGLTRATMKKLGKGIKRSMAMGLMHRWQNK
ncbi:hypothetical protein BDY24DRAFT_328823, partial [Mrakia frigida]|uniref:bS18 family ribosomal protein n=1 Tax=Mrakia frigida TaxID=29902 RepID=UPI003FCC036C